MHIFILELDILAYNRNINAIIENIIIILYYILAATHFEASRGNYGTTLYFFKRKMYYKSLGEIFFL